MPLSGEHPVDGEAVGVGVVAHGQWPLGRRGRGRRWVAPVAPRLFNWVNLANAPFGMMSACDRHRCFASLNGYRRSWARADLAAGLTLLAIAVPEQLATSGWPACPRSPASTPSSPARCSSPLGSSPHMSVGATRRSPPCSRRGLRAGARRFRRTTWTWWDPRGHGRAHSDARRASCGSVGSPSSSRPPSSPASCPGSRSSSSPISCPTFSAFPRPRAPTSTAWPTS